MISMCGGVTISAADRFAIRIVTENLAMARKCYILLDRSFHIHAEVSIRLNAERRRRSYMLLVRRHEDAVRVLKAVKLLNEDLEIREDLSVVSNQIIQNSCCRRAFIRGAFLAAGSISDPHRFYHYELACAGEPKARQLQALLQTFDLDAKIVVRKKYFVVYIKEGAQIVDALNVMEAPVSLMELENIRIVREMRNSVNRKVNCETANINKTVNAAVKQIEDIRYLSENRGLSELPEQLAEMARVRLEYPDATLKELGTLLSPPVGKSGVNHRLRKLSQMAEELRNNKEE